MGDERSGARTQAGTRPGARADVEEPANGRPVSGLRGERPPEKVLVERKRAAVGIAVLEIRVRSLQVCRREHDAFADRGLEIREVPGDSSLDSVRIALPEVLGPDAGADIELDG